MRHFTLLTMVLAIVSMGSIVSAQLLDENFDSLGVGTNMQSVEGWEGWYGDESVAGHVTDEQAHSGNHSLRFTRPVDATPFWNSPTSGNWILSTMQYVPSAATSGDAYYGVLHSYEEGTAGSAGWITEVISDFAAGDVRISGGDTVRVPLVRDAWAEIKVELDFDAQVSTFYYNGEYLGTREAPSLSGFDLWANSDDVMYFDDFWLGTVDMYGTQASNLNPEDGASDIVRDVILSWEPGSYADTHDVYFGTALEDVNDASRDNPLGALGSQGQSHTSYEPDGLLAFGQIYYWRVDEVNAAPDFTIFKGAVQSFTAEPYSAKVSSDEIKVTASSSDTLNPPSKTTDESGLDDNLHSNKPTDMWMSAAGDASPWLKFEFDTVQKLDKMLIWNSNHSSEAVIGWGIQNADIQVSTDGIEWTSVPDVGAIARASGNVPSEAQAIDMGLAQVKYVMINILDNWGGIIQQYGVAEVQFYGIPVYARTPNPASGSADVHPNTVASWRAGRDVSQHAVYVSMDMTAVRDGTVSPISTPSNSLDLAPLDLQLEETYYWRVDEVNDTEDPSVWAGPVWSMTMRAAVTVDDFEGYSNKSPNRPFQTWLDGIGYSSDEFFPVAYEGNGTGAAVGHDIWSVGSPHFGGSIMEGNLTLEGSSQSLPLYYNTGVTPQMDRTWATPQDWTKGGAQTLVLYFYGAPENTGQLYIQINKGTKINYDGSASAITTDVWTQWNIDLTSLGADSQNVTQFSIGVQGGSGMVLIDDILLYRNAP